MPRPDAARADYRRYTAIHSAAETASHARHGELDSPFHHLHARVQTPEGRDLLRDRGPEGRVGIFHHQRRESTSLSVEDSLSLLHSYGRVRPYGAWLLDLRHHYNFRHLRCSHGR